MFQVETVTLSLIKILVCLLSTLSFLFREMIDGVNVAERSIV